MEEYSKQRSQLLEESKKLRFDYDIKLSEKEQKVNEILKELVKKEFEAEKQSEMLTAGFYDRQATVENSTLYKALKKLPKGAVLHAHFLGLFDISKVLDFASKHQNVRKTKFTFYQFYIYPKDDGKHPLHKGGYFKPNEVPEGFVLFSELEKQEKNLKAQVLKSWTMNGDDLKTPNRWNKFQKCFDRQWATLWFEEQFVKNYDLTIEALLEDNIQYVETNVPLGALYNFDKKFNADECAEIFLNLSKKAANEYPKDFFGIHVVHETSRRFDTNYVYKHMKEAIDLQKKYGNFICGYDLVGHEDGPGSHESAYFVESQLKIKQEAKEQGVDFRFILHGGETLNPVENLFDLVLLGTKRIGHGFNLFRYPKLYDIIRDNGVCLEVCPISNQVLGYVDDLRNHHAIGYLANNLPIVISPDDPCMMGYLGVTHDFFVTMLYWNLDLAGIKKLILNSFKYSTLLDEQKEQLQKLWESKYQQFLEEVMKNYES